MNETIIPTINNIDNLDQLINSNGIFFYEYSDQDSLIINEAINQTKLYFGQQLDEKNNQSITDEYIGYRPKKMMCVKNKNDDITKYSETFSYRIGCGYKLHTIFDSYYEIVSKCAEKIFDKISLLLKIDEKFDFCNTLQMIHYPESQNDEKKGIPDHTDWGFLTILVTTEKGLQVKMKNEWIDVPVVPNHFIINLADMMEIISDHKLKAITHRVITKREKYSIAFFMEPTRNSYVKNIRFGDYFKSKINVLLNEFD